jgi:hypothetical protein
MSKPILAAAAAAINTAPSVEDMLQDPTPSSLMGLMAKLGTLMQKASVAFANVHASTGRVDRGNYREQDTYTGPTLDAQAMARLHAMSTACAEFAYRMRDARLIGVHDDKERAKILSDYTG